MTLRYMDDYHFTTDGETISCTFKGETRTWRYRHKPGMAFVVRKTFVGSGYGPEQLVRDLNDPFWSTWANAIWETARPLEAA